MCDVHLFSAMLGTRVLIGACNHMVCRIHACRQARVLRGWAKQTREALADRALEDR